VSPRLRYSQALGVAVYAGMAAASSLMTCFIALGVCALVSGCPQWERPRCPTPGVYSCVREHPYYCAPSRELTPMGDEPCTAQGRVCALDDAGRASCEPRR
jgi:hypothetical protein